MNLNLRIYDLMALYICIYYYIMNAHHTSFCLSN